MIWKFLKHFSVYCDGAILVCYRDRNENVINYSQWAFLLFFQLYSFILPKLSADTKNIQVSSLNFFQNNCSFNAFSRFTTSTQHESHLYSKEIPRRLRDIACDLFLCAYIILFICLTVVMKCTKLRACYILFNIWNDWT